MALRFRAYPAQNWPVESDGRRIFAKIIADAHVNETKPDFNVGGPGDGRRGLP
jgi:hypothetical protein